MLARPLPPEFESRTWRIAPGEALGVDASRFRDALVIVARGRVEVRTGRGASARFGPGDVLCLAGFGAASVHNRGGEPAMLVSVARRPLPAAEHHLHSHHEET